MANFDTSQGPAGVSAYVRPTSAGPGTNNSFSDLFKDVGNIGQAAIASVDQNNVEMIQQNATKGVDNALSDWNYKGAPDPNAGTPDELKSYATNLAKTKQAWESGSIKDSNFEIRVDALSRRMRAQYPGYEDKVDQIIGQTLNRSTANDLRKQLQSEWTAEAGKNNTQAAKEDNIIRGYAKQGYMGQAFPNYYTDLAQGKPVPSFLEVQAKVMPYIEQDATVAKTKAMNALAISNNTITTKNMIDQGSKEADRVVQATLNTGLNGMKLEDIPAKFDGTKGYSDQDYQGTLAAMNTAKAQIQLKLQGIFSQPGYENMTIGQQKAIIDKAMGPINSVSDALLNKDTGTLATMKSLRDSTKAQDIRTFNAQVGDDGKEAPEVTLSRKAAVANSVFGADYGKRILDNKGSSSDVNDALIKISKLDLASGRSLSKTMDAANKASSSGLTPAGQKSIFDNAVQTILDPTVTNKEPAATAMFGPDNKDFLTKFSPVAKPGQSQSDREKAFQQMTSPAVTASIVEAAKSNPSILENYKEFLGNSFKSVFSEEINTVKSIQANSDNTRITYDPDTQRFTAVTSKSDSIFHGDADPFNVIGSKAQQTVNKLNMFMGNLTPAMKATGADPTKAALELVQSTGAMTTEKQGGILDKVGKALFGAIKPETDANTAVTRNASGLPNIPDPKDAGKIFHDPDPNAKLRDFIAKAEGSDYTSMNGGDKSPYNGLPLDKMSIAQVKQLQAANVHAGFSSAAGRYQINRQTLDEFQKRAGVSDDALFTPEVQDKLGNAIIDSTGRDPVALSGRWAGLPKDESGAGTYDGVAGNKATVSWADFGDALKGF